MKKHKPDNMTCIESILEKNNDIMYYERWHPTTVSTFESLFKNDAFKKMNTELRKNICYSLVYLQYLQLQFDEIHLHNVVEKLLYKTYIITAMSIIEGIFYYLVKSNSLQKSTDWKSEDPVYTNIFTEDEEKIRYKIIKEIKSKEPIEEKMDFEYLINRVQGKKLISLHYQVYPQIKALKRLRNKVHLQITTRAQDTDYYNFDDVEYILVRSVLYLVLTNKSFYEKPPIEFGFIKPSKSEIEKLKNHLKKEKS